MPRFNAIDSVDDLLGYLDIFCQVVAQLQADPTIALNEIAGKISQEVSASTISNCIARLEEHYSETLIERRPKSAMKQITPFGETLYEQSRQVIRDVRLLKGPPANLRQVNVVSSNFLLSLMPQVVSAYYEARGESRAKLTFHDVHDPDDLVKQLANFRVDLAIRWSKPSAPHERADTTETVALGDQPFDVVLVMHPSHRFVNEQREHIDLRDLATERLYHIPPALQILMSELPPASGAGERIEVDYYDTVLRFIRTGIAGAVGIVPGLYDELDHFRRLGELFYLQIAGSPKIGIAVTTRRGGVQGLSPEAKQFYTLFEQQLNKLSRHPGWPPGRRQPHAPLDPDSCSRLTEIYYVSSHADHPTPSWYHGQFKWTKWKKAGRDNEFTATMTVINDTTRRYEVEGKLLTLQPGHSSLYFTAKWAGTSRVDAFFAVFNSANDGKPIWVGTWSGVDELGRSTSAPMILSKDKLDFDALHEASRRSAAHTLLQARKLTTNLSASIPTYSTAPAVYC